MEEGEKPLLGRRVVVYGGGNTAMDAARTAKRLGATEAIVVYRRTRERMPAHDFEVEEAEEEGVMMKWLSTIKHADEGKLVLERMELDETGFPQPTGELEELEADSLVLALGQEADLSLLDGVPGLEVEDGVVKVGPDMMTGHPGIFAGGDMVPAERTVTVGVGHGKRAARHIDGWLRGTALRAGAEARAGELRQAQHLVLRRRPANAPPPAGGWPAGAPTFDEVVHGLDESNALYEARRCLSCGNCFSCDNCYGVCPDNAVLKLSDAADANVNGYEIDLDYCKGCGMCVAGVPVRGDRDGAGGDLTEASEGLPEMAATYPAHREADVVLRDGSTLSVRPVRSADEQALRRFFEGLSDQSRTFRFFSAATSTSDAVSRALDVDYHDTFGLVATRGAPSRAGRPRPLRPHRGSARRGGIRDRGWHAGSRSRDDPARPPGRGGRRHRGRGPRGGDPVREPPHDRGLPGERLPVGALVGARLDPRRAADLAVGGVSGALSAARRDRRRRRRAPGSWSRAPSRSSVRRGTAARWAGRSSTTCSMRASAASSIP